MKKILSCLILLILVSCGSSKTTGADKPLYEILLSEEDGGADFEFYELLTTEKEIKMLLADPKLKRKVKASDIKVSNFILLNRGRVTAKDQSITVASVEEVDNQIRVKVKYESIQDASLASTEELRPFTLVRINSKKPIVILDEKNQ